MCTIGKPAAARTFKITKTNKKPIARHQIAISIIGDQTEALTFMQTLEIYHSGEESQVDGVVGAPRS